LKYWGGIRFPYPSIILKWLHQDVNWQSQGSTCSRSTKSNVKNTSGKEKYRRQVWDENFRDYSDKNKINGVKHILEILYRLPLLVFHNSPNKEKTLIIYVRKCSKYKISDI